MTIMSPDPTAAALGIAILMGLPPARTVSAEPLTPPEAVAHLLFSGVTTAMPKSVSPGRVTYRGNMIPGDPERTILSISASRAAPCLFDAFFIEAPTPVMDPKIAVTTAYHATIDLRRLARATFTPTPQAAGGAQLVLAAKEMFCSRSIILEQTPKLTYSESCLDTIDDAIQPDDVPRLRAAFEVLRSACQW
ncbi:MAG: hypothetical protein Q8O26_14425 [Phreatobacter sp.]|uniref:hypothetical protein n=1 Tax=Phreatobacter sp. TaxID=1966341 RepID=UPI00273265F8|nr:hypothetical protein [Phreatobacter sp.]MDP2803068.1 hypothetical protein [Phreatobacter sp.]